MSEFNILSYNIKEILSSNNFNNNINFIKCLDDENNNYEIELLFNENNLKIFTDLNNYCYIKSFFDEDKINQIILFNKNYKSIESIIKSIDNYKINSNIRKRIKYEDIYHFFEKVPEKTKVDIDFTILKKTINKNKNLNIKIPKELLLNENQIFQLIINEIKKINSNFEYKHFIKPIENDIYNLQVNLIDDNLKFPIILEIKLNQNLYPFLPPAIELVNPKIKLSLQLAFMNLNITKINNWNSAISLEWIIVNLFLKLKPIINEYIDTNNEVTDLSININKLGILRKEIISDKINIDLDIPKNNKINNKGSLYWKSGTGYGSGSANEWNIKDYIKEKELMNIEISKCLDNINININKDSINVIKENKLLDYLINISKEFSLLEIESNPIIFNSFSEILLKFLINDYKDLINNNFIKNIVNNLKLINDEVLLLFKNNEMLQNNELYQSIHYLYQKYSELVIIENDDINIGNNYCDIMKNLQFKMVELNKNHLFNKYASDKIESNSLKRIISEISSFKNCLPLNEDSTIWIRIPKNNMNLFTF